MGRVFGKISIVDCPNLSSLEGFPFGALEYSVEECPLVPEDHFRVMKDHVLRHDWWNSGEPLEEWVLRYRGRIRGRRFGI